jgi:hypothetical protein
LRVSGLGIGRQSALQPGKQFALTSSGAGLQIGHDHDLELQALGLVDGHQLHTAIAVGFGIGNGGQFLERRMERGAEEIGLAFRKAVEAAPKQIEIHTRRSVDALCAAQPQPTLLEPGAQRGSGLLRAQAIGEISGAQQAVDGLAAFDAEKLRALGKELGNRTREELG